MTSALKLPKGGYINISDSRLAEWRATYKGVDIDEQIAKANDWLKRNPSKAWKTLAGFENWLSNSESVDVISKTVDYEDSIWGKRDYERQHPSEPYTGTDRKEIAMNAIAKAREILKGNG